LPRLPRLSLSSDTGRVCQTVCRPAVNRPVMAGGRACRMRHRCGGCGIMTPGS
jgi:hypothetical protein